MATTSMNFTLSSTLLGNLTKGGSGNGAYVFAFAFDGNGNLLGSSTLLNSGVAASTSLQLANGSTVSGGNVIVVTQQVGKGNTSTLPSTVKAIGDLLNTQTATQLNYRYDAIEFTLLNTGSDVADLTNIVQFGAPISLSVTYSDGTTQTRGYSVSGKSIVNKLTDLSPPGKQNYPWAKGGPLTGQRETLGLANNVNPNPLNVSSDWKSYVSGFTGIVNSVYLSAYFNDTGMLSLYKVVYDKSNKVFWLNPVSLGKSVPTTTDSIKIPYNSLTQNIYTQTGSLSVYTDMNGKLIETYSTFTPNNAWGQITRSLVSGFDAGMWGGSAKSLNPLVSGKIDLNQTWNWSAPYTYQAITAPDGTKNFGYKNSIGMGTGTVGDPNRKMYYDPFAAVFVKYSNAYGYSYSDLLSEGGGINPSLSIFDPGTNSDVSKIDVKLFDLNETPTGYTDPGFPYVAPSGSTYNAADTSSTDQFLFDFSLGSYFPVSGVPITFSFYAPGDSQAKNNFVSFSLPTGTTQGKDYQQSFTVTGKPGKWTLQANGYSGSPGFLLISNVPVTKNGSTGWYQMTIGTGSLAKTYNMYVDSSSSSPTSHISSAVVDGGALAQLIPNQANQVKFSFDPSGNVTYSPYYFSSPNAQVGGARADRLASVAGAELLAGGSGNDFYEIDDSADQVVEVSGDGKDKVFASVDYALAAGQSMEVLRASVGTTGLILSGNELGNRIVGRKGDDTLDGGRGADELIGNGGEDILNGGAGNDILDGGNRSDMLAGGVGEDIFRFSTPLVAGNVDTIADFGAGDSIELDHTVFDGLAPGQLGASGFAFDTATGAGPQIVYDQIAGALFFDSNGAAAGGATQFASLTGAPGLDASDIKVI
ncbi:MAG: calcium-binding protein [Enhydrobacter sp.]|nr:calcium-binding protein [Enhydrobacter sp.]